MSAPIIWIIMPAICSLALFGVRRWRQAMVIGGSLAAGVFAGLAWLAPIGVDIKIFHWSFQIGDTLSFFGRRLFLDMADRPVLLLIFLTATFWFAGANAARVSSNFIPFGLGITALFTSALAVEPFLYAAIILGITVLISVPILATPGVHPGRGLMRYITLQLLGMPFILLTGWLLAGVESSPGDPALAAQAGVVTALGFGFFLAIFPFHIWIPLIIEEAQPYAATFVLIILSSAVAFFGINFLDRYPWLSGSSWLFVYLRLFGVIMVVVGGGWAAFQRRVGRMMGYVIIFEIGITLLAISIGVGSADARPELAIFFDMLTPRMLALGVWALAWSILQREVDGDKPETLGIAMHRYPLAAIAMLCAIFSLAGLPMLAGFPMYYALWQALARSFPLAQHAALIGGIGVTIGGIRLLATFISTKDSSEARADESNVQRFYLGAGILILFVLGIFPQLYLPFVTRLALTFLGIQP